MITTPIHKLSRPALRKIILVIFFLSGAFGLVYEIAWLRVLSLIFGNTTFATSTVLAGYMAGLGLGALYFGKKADRTGNPVRLYALLEGGVGIYAFLTPLLWGLIEWIHVGFYRAFEPSFIIFSLFRFVVAFLFLFVPTFLMGGTLPVLTRYFVRVRSELAQDVGLLYALNTLGAVAGVLLSGFVLLYTVGVWQTVILAGIFNLMIFGVLIGVPAVENAVGKKETSASQDGPCAPETAGPVVPVASRKWAASLLLVLFGFSGAVSMMYEVGWTRVLAIVLGSSIYAFSVMLATFLLGIGLGSYVFSRMAARRKPDLVTFALLQFLTAFTALIALNQFDDLPYYFLRLYEWSHQSLLLIELGKFAYCAMIMLAPTLCIGAMFACFIHVYQHSESLGFEVGSAYFSNTIGTIVGSASTGFLIIPWIGIQHTLMAASGINAVIGLTAFFLAAGKWKLRRLIPAALLFGLVTAGAFQVQAWDQRLITSGVVVRPGEVSSADKQAFYQNYMDKEMLFYKEGTSATVSVRRVRDQVSLAVNGKTDASNNDAFTQYLLGHLPMILHENPKKVMVIGLGSASTMAAVAAHPVEILHGVEIESAVIEASEYFTDLNRDVLRDPRVTMFVNDGRNILLIRPEKYDVIISEPSNPWMAGVANLFSREHYRTMKARLRPGGLVCQWFHAYSMSADDLKMIVRTFGETFPHMSLWTSYYPDLMLIGSERPVSLTQERLNKAFENPWVKKDIGIHGMSNPLSFLSCYWLGDAELRKLSQDAKINSDNYPYLEFSAPRNLYRATGQVNYELLSSHWRPHNAMKVFKLDQDPRKLFVFYTAVADGLISKKMFSMAMQVVRAAGLIEPEHPDYLRLRGLLCFEGKQWDEAETFLSQAVTKDPDSAQIYYFLGKIHVQKKREDEALQSFARAVELEPDNRTYQSALADQYAAGNKAAEAIEIYREILATHGTDFETLAKLSNLVFVAEGPDSKVKVSEELMNAYPRFVQNIERYAQLLDMMRRPEEALRIYQKLVREFPPKDIYYIGMGKAYEGIGNQTEMRKALKQAVRLNPGLLKNEQVKKLLR